MKVEIKSELRTEYTIKLPTISGMLRADLVLTVYGNEPGSITAEEVQAMQDGLEQLTLRRTA